MMLGRRVAGGQSVLATSLSAAREVAQEHFGKPVEDVLPVFSQTYPRLQKALRESPGYTRVQMPVIGPRDLEDFREKLSQGEFRERTARDTGLVLEGGVPSKYVQVPAGKIKPTQKEVWLDKVFGALAKQGVPHSGSAVLKIPAIVSAELDLLDGHHRWAQVLLADPELRMHVLHVALSTEKLLEIGNLYSDSVGNVRKQGSQFPRGPVLRLASELPTGSPERRVLLEALRKG